MEHESDGDTNSNWCSWHCHQKIGKRTGGHGNEMTKGVHPNYSIVELGQNTDKSHGDLRRWLSLKLK